VKGTQALQEENSPADFLRDNPHYIGAGLCSAGLLLLFPCISHMNMAENAFINKGSYRVPLSLIIMFKVFSGLNRFRL
jgi:hypothetical protein